MRSFPVRNLNQTAVYWGTPVADGYGGYTFDDPIEIKCRWVESIEIVRDVKGNEKTSSAKVYVDQDLADRGWLFLGTLLDLSVSEEADPVGRNGSYQIIKVNKTPTLSKPTKYFRKVYL